MPSVDFLESSLPEGPSRKDEREIDKGFVRADDYSVATDLLMIEKARGAAYVQAVLNAYAQQENEPYGRENIPTPQQGQSRFLVGEKMRVEGQNAAFQRMRDRATAFGQWVAGAFKENAASARVITTLGGPSWSDPLVVAEIEFPSDRLVKAGFRRSDRDMNAFDPSMGVWHASHNKVHESGAGQEVLRSPGLTAGLNLAGPYAGDDSFAYNAKWGFHHDGRTKQWMPADLKGKVVDFDPRVPMSNLSGFQAHGFQLRGVDENTVRAWVLGHFADRR